MDLKTNEWNKSYDRLENHIFFPKEEVVKFLSRYIKKPIAVGKFINLLKKEQLTALDFGCGLGINLKLLDDFGIKAIGIDISEVALEKAKNNFISLNKEHLIDNVFLSTELNLDFEDNLFDVIIADSVLDSMPFNYAKTIFNEFFRTLNQGGYIYLSLIGGSEEKCSLDEEISSAHEQGTIQSYFNIRKINQFFGHLTLEAVSIYSTKFESLTSNSSYTRYHVILKKF